MSKAVKHYSKLLKQYFYLYDDGFIRFVDDKGFDTVQYSREEVLSMKALSDKAIKKIHEAKMIFSGSSLVDVIDNKQQPLFENKD